MPGFLIVPLVSRRDLYQYSQFRLLHTRTQCSIVSDRREKQSLFSYQNGLQEAARSTSAVALCTGDTVSRWWKVASNRSFVLLTCLSLKVFSLLLPDVVIPVCGLPASLSSMDRLWVNDRPDNLWIKTAKWSIDLISCLRQ